MSMSKSTKIKESNVREAASEKCEIDPGKYSSIVRSSQCLSHSN